MTSKKDALNRGMHAVEQAGYRLSGMAIALLLAGVCLQSPAQAADKSGKEVYEQSCSQCHATGANGAPKVGDEAAWKKLSSQSLTSLTGVVLSGIRKMPPHGANMKLSDTELKRAVTYMVNQSGGKWVEPVSKKQPAAARTGEQIVKMRCSKCHETGKGGAPKIGDQQAWISASQGRPRCDGALGDQRSRRHACACRHARSHRRGVEGRDHLHDQQGPRTGSCQITSPRARKNFEPFVRSLSSSALVHFA